MDTYRLIGRIVVAIIITRIVAAPLMSLLIRSIEQGSIEQGKFLIITIFLIIFSGIKKSKENN